MKNKVLKSKGDTYINLETANKLEKGAASIYKEILKRGTKEPIKTEVFYKVVKTKNSLKIHRLLTSLKEAGLISY